MLRSASRVRTSRPSGTVKAPPGGPSSVLIVGPGKRYPPVLRHFDAFDVTVVIRQTGECRLDRAPQTFGCSLPDRNAEN